MALGRRRADCLLDLISFCFETRNLLLNILKTNCDRGCRHLYFPFCATLCVRTSELKFESSKAFYFELRRLALARFRVRRQRP